MFFRRKKLLSKPIKILLITNSLVLFSGAMLGPIYALFVDDIGGNLLDASLAGGIFALAAGITVLISGQLTDRVKESELIVVFGYVVVGIGFISLAFVETIWSLLAVQALIGFGEAIYSPAYDAIYTKHLDGHKEGRQWSLWESMYYFTTFVGAIIGGLIADQYGFQPLFYSMGAISFISAFYILALPRKTL